MDNEIQLDKDIMVKLGIQTVFLFGSHAQKTDNPLSDYDFGIILNDKSVLKNRILRNKIYDTFYDIVSSKIKKLIDIDIVFLDEMPLQLKYHVVKDGIIIYSDNLNKAGNFKEQIILQHADFAPLRNEFHESILARI